MHRIRIRQRSYAYPLRQILTYTSKSHAALYKCQSDSQFSSKNFITSSQCGRNQAGFISYTQHNYAWSFLWCFNLCNIQTLKSWNAVHLIHVTLLKHICKFSATCFSSTILNFFIITFNHSFKCLPLLPKDIKSNTLTSLG